MYDLFNQQRYPYYHTHIPFNNYTHYPFINASNRLQFLPNYYQSSYLKLKDEGANPYVVNMDKATKQNSQYRLALWTGNHLQVTLMSLKPGEDIGLEIHPHLDQFIMIVDGSGTAKMGHRKDRLSYVKRVSSGSAIMIPAGTWHNVKNNGFTQMKLYSIYAPPAHPFGTQSATKAEAQASEY